MTKYGMETFDVTPSEEVQISANSRKVMLSLSGILKDRSLSIIRNGLQQ
jgi:hypothetical protein